MGVTEIGHLSAQDQQIWSKSLFRETIYKTYSGKFMGTSENSIVQRFIDLEKNAGDILHYDLLMQMTQMGVVGDNPMEGFEEALVFHQDSIRIDQRRLAHAFRRMSQVRTVHNLREKGRSNLAMQWANVIDLQLFAYAAGTAGDNVTLAATLPHAANPLNNPAGGADDDHYLNKSDETFRTSHIEFLVEQAKTIAPIIRPAVVDGEELYVLVVRPEMLTDLRTDSTNSLWVEVTKHAKERGASNPFFTGMVGEWAGVMIYDSTRIPKTGNIAHNFFGGAQALTCSFGNAEDQVSRSVDGSEGVPMAWEERQGDYRNERGVSGGAIYGIKETRFNSKRFGMIRYDALSTTHRDVA